MQYTFTTIKKITFLLLLIFIILLGCENKNNPTEYKQQYYDFMSPSENEVLRLSNLERIKAGKTPLLATASYEPAAAVRAEESSISFSHTRPDGGDAYSALTDRGLSVRFFGENLTAGSSTASQAVESWMNSPGHRQNILSELYTHMVVGYHYRDASTYKHYWVQIFYTP